MRRLLAGGLLAVLVTSAGPSVEAASPELDPAFGAGGRAVIDAGGTERLNDLAVQPDGSVVAVGQVLDGGGVHALAVRLRPDGQVDPSFGTRRLTGVAGVDEKAHAVAVQPDGRILVAGETTAGQDAAVWRLRSDGSPDPTFSDDGFATVPDAGGAERADAVAVAPDGGVVVGGFSTKDSRAFVARLTPAGAPDTAFDGDGLRLVGGATYYHDVRAVAVQPDGKVVATGANGGTTGAPVYRLRTDGSDDPTFGGTGQVDIPGTVFDGRDLVLRADGSMVVLTQTLPAGAAREVPVLVRLDGAGSVDAAFGFGAGQTLGIGGEFSQGQELAARVDGFVVAVTSVDRGVVLAAVDADGKPDPEFGLTAPSGVVPTGLGVQPSGGFVLAVDTTTGAEVDRLRGDARPAVVPTCHGRPATLVGTEGKDRIRGTAHDDVIVALGGADVIRASSGDDVVCGGAGDDRVSGGSGRDRLYGERGRDRLVGGSGKDRLVGGAGRDRLR